MHNTLSDCKSTSGKAPRLLGLDLIRGLCAVSVMIYHYCHLAKWGDPFAMGTFGVYIFFVLSGFALYYVYGRRTVDETFLKEFFVSRYLRIMPLFFSVAVYRLWGQPVEPYNFTRLLVHATPLIGIADPASFSKVMVGGWSIIVEWSFYLLFPLLMLFRDIKSLATLFVFTLVLNYSYTMGGFFPPEKLRPGQALAYTETLTFLCYFVGGMLGAKTYLEAPEVMARLRRLPSPLYISLAAVSGIFILPIVLPYDGRVDFLSGLDASAIILVTVGLVILAALQQPEGILAKASSFLGDVSFAVYLLHVYVWNNVGRAIDPPHWLQFVIAGPMTLALSYLVYRFFENPMRNIRKWHVWHEIGLTTLPRAKPR